jgi:hypothetical protein
MLIAADNYCAPNVACKWLGGLGCLLRIPARITVNHTGFSWFPSILPDKAWNNTLKYTTTVPFHIFINLLNGV